MHNACFMWVFDKILYALFDNLVSRGRERERDVFLYFLVGLDMGLGIVSNLHQLGFLVYLLTQLICLGC